MICVEVDEHLNIGILISLNFKFFFISKRTVILFSTTKLEFLFADDNVLSIISIIYFAFLYLCIVYIFIKFTFLHFLILQHVMLIISYTSRGKKGIAPPVNTTTGGIAIPQRPAPPTNIGMFK